MWREEEKVIRRDNKIRLLGDPWSGRESLSGSLATGYYLSDNGGLESFSVERTCALDCGCIAEPTGVCIECVAQGYRGYTCANCYLHCPCGRPVCLSHCGVLGFLTGNGITELRLCGPCYQSEIKCIRRDEFVRRLLPFLRI